MKRQVVLPPLVPLAALLCTQCAEHHSAQVASEYEGGRVLPSPTNFAALFLLDDGSSGESAALRESYLAALANSIRNAQPCGDNVYPPDPAAWCEMHWHGVLVAASASAVSRLTGPNVAPAFTLDGVYAPGAIELDLLAIALENEIGARVDSSNSPLIALDSLYSVFGLLKGWRRPTDDNESELLASLGRIDSAQFVIASARDDESPDPVESYAPTSEAQLGSSPVVGVNSVVLASSQQTSNCFEGIEQYKRFNQWSNLVGPLYGPQPWPHPIECGAIDILPAPSEQGVHCTEHYPAFTRDGLAKCHMFVPKPDDGICSTELGWSYPSGTVAPFEGDPPGEEYCEVQQLTSAALASCEFDLQCTDCSPGFCFTQVPELTAFCSNQGLYALPRIVHGADAGGRAKVKWRCESGDERDR